MDTKVEIKPFKTKWIKKKFINSKKIFFEDKYFQATVLIPDALDPNLSFEPKITMSLVLGNDKFRILADDATTLTGLLENLLNFIGANRNNLDRFIVREKDTWYRRQKSLKAQKKGDNEVINKDTGEITTK